jgi:hypothetical protein
MAGDPCDFGVFGLGVLVASAFMLSIACYYTWRAAISTGGEHDLAAVFARRTLEFAIGVALGCIWLASALAWWRGRWRWAILTALVGFAAIAIAGLAG